MVRVLFKSQIPSASCGTTMSQPRLHRDAGTSPSTTAASAATICTTMNAGADDGRMPANVLLNMRAIVTAGLANDVDDVNQ